MAQLLGPEPTTFTLDNMGRNLCNTLQEALDSLNAPVAGNQRGFDVIVIGGGTFGATIAEGLFVRDATRSRRRSPGAGGRRSSCTTRRTTR